MAGKPPNIRLRGLRSPDVPAGFLLGRLPGTGSGEVQLLSMSQLRQFGLASKGDTNAATATLKPENAWFDAGGLLAAAELLGEWAFPRDVTFNTGNADTFFTAILAAASDSDLPLYSNASGSFVQIGHVHYAAGALTGSLVLTSNPMVLAAHDRIRLTAPASPDATLSDLYGLIAGA